MATIVSKVSASTVLAGHSCPELVKQEQNLNGTFGLPLISKPKRVRVYSKLASSKLVIKSQSGQSEGGAWEETGGDVIYVPRICTLREFANSNGSSEVVVAKPDQERSMAEILMACVEASAQVSDFETLSGRLAMIGFAAALSVEFVTGNSVFSGMGVEGLAKVISLCVVATGVAAGFAVGWRSKKRVSDILASGCKRLMDTAVDSMIEGLFFDDGRDTQWQKQGTEMTRK